MLHQSKIAKESLLSCRTTGVNGVGMFARQQVIAHPVYCALTALTQEATTDRVEVTRQPVSSWVSDHQRIPDVVCFGIFGKANITMDLFITKFSLCSVMKKETTFASFSGCCLHYGGLNQHYRLLRST